MRALLLSSCYLLMAPVVPLGSSPATTTTGSGMSDAPLDARNQDLFTSNIIVAAVFVSPPSG
jgi:hypothetical protein